jgi:nitroimidazol reductase NimA-like FMN-containing flavoprotein (pyridoxamine 5'-phosphate oxidase superfamily)
MIAHVGVQTPDGPLVLPMAYGRDDDTLYLHGAAANHLLGTGDGHEICATVTLVDGLVMARTPFHNSMNYRSVVVRGLATKIDRQATKRSSRR